MWCCLLCFCRFSYDLQLKISPVMGIIRKIKVAGQTIRTPQLLHSETVDTQGFQNLYLSNFSQ